MFVSAVIPLQATNTPGTAPYLGRECHAFFLRAVAKADATLAQALHASSAAKPFTVSPVMAGTRPASCEGAICAGGEYWLRVTSLDERLSSVLVQEVLPNLARSARLGPAEFVVRPALLTADAHPWAGSCSAEDLLARWMGTPHLPAYLTLHFATPTCTRRIAREWILPTPQVVFAGLLHSWNAHSGSAFDGNLGSVLEADVVPSRYRLRSVPVAIGDAQLHGWVGRITYRIFGGRALRSVLHTLADFALYSGFGYKTTQGMGQTRALRVARTDCGPAGSARESATA